MNENTFKNLSDMLENADKSDTSENKNNFNFFNNIMSDFSQNNNENGNNNVHNNGFDFSNIDMDTMRKIGNIMGKMNSNASNPRSNLLSSLKPYLKPSRRDKVDQYIQLVNITSLIENLNNNGGEK